MSDNVDNVIELHKIQPSRKRIIWLGIAVFAVVLILLVILFPEVLNLDAVGRFFRYGSDRKDESYGRVSFDAHSSNRYALWSEGLALTSVGGVEIYEEEGRRTVQKAAPLSAPAIAAGQNVTLCYDIGGDTVLAYKNGTEVVMETEIDGILLDADISSGDAICTAASESGHKTVLRVYDKNQQEVYRWFSASRFMPFCAVSQSARHMAAIGLGQKDGSFCSTLYFFRTDTEEPLHSVDLGGRLVYDLKFLGENRICVMCEDGLFIYDVDGTEHGSYSLASWYLEDFDLSGDGFAAFSLNMYKAGDRCSVVTVDHQGKELGSLFVGAEILDISACGKYLAVLTTEKLMILHKDLSEYVVCENQWMATSALMRNDGTVYLISGGTAELYIP